MTTIGNATSAALIRNHFIDDIWYGGTKRCPRGWNRIGEGAFRSAFLNKAENVIYKLGADDANTSEARNEQRLRRKSTRNLGFELRVPRTRLYRVSGESVIAQEFAKGGKFTHCAANSRWAGWNPKCSCRRDLCFAEVLEKVGQWSGLEDMHSGNVLLDPSGVFWLIDLGC